MDRGRPRKYSSAEDMQADIDAYFAECVANEKPPTVAGLAYRLDMTTECFRNYGTQEDYSVTVKKAKQRIEIFLEESLSNPSCTGTIFNLKNNFGWRDRSEQALTNAEGGPVQAEVKWTVEFLNASPQG